MPVICPGAANIKGAPELKIKLCPDCGTEIELFTGDLHSACARCGFVAYNSEQSCVSWCRYAKECVGEEMYERMTNKNK